MRTAKLAVATALAVGGATIALSAGGASVTRGRASHALPTLSSCQQKVKKLTYQPGTLTVATDDPVYAPWFVSNNPSNGKGYESAVTYAIASLLGFTHKKVTWAYEPFSSSYAPGPKRFDFDIKSKRGDSEPLAQRTTAFAFWNTSRLFLSK